MFTLREKTSGRSKTPIRTSFAVRNGVALKLESSATLRSLAIRLPEKGAKLRSPNFTLRPSVVVSCDSMMGRKVFAFTKKEIDATPRTTSPTSANSIFVQRFTENLSAMASKRQQTSRQEVYDEQNRD